MHKILLLFTILVTAMKAQTTGFVNDLFYSYDNYYNRTITTKKFPPAEYNKIMDDHAASGLLKKELLGSSITGKPLNLYTWGKGKTKLFLWSQMHGDESTASLALLDIYNFLSDTAACKNEKALMSEKLTLYFLPLVNPDGAEQFTRRNDIYIDLNRDAVRLTTPEAKILMETFLRIQPDYAYNLHDQNPRYSVGKSANVAAISFLAPAPDVQKSMTQNRINAVKVIAGMTEVLNKYIPGHTAKYDDEFEPRAFGDNFQKLGAATILIESGGWKDDEDKQFIRKLNYLIMLESFLRISQNKTDETNQTLYEALPFNDTRIFDVVIRNCTYRHKGQTFTIDVAFNRSRRTASSGEHYFVSGVEEMGDLSVFFGHDEIDFTGYEIEPGKKSGETINLADAQHNPSKFHVLGITTLRGSGKKNSENFSKFPFNITYNSDDADEIRLNGKADFVLKKNGKVEYLFINGFMVYPATGAGSVTNGLIYR